MSRSARIAVIGAGIFGVQSALKLVSCGFSVSLFERSPDCLSGASLNNQNRLHLGFHYPRDMKTARQCVRGFDSFVEKFAGCIESEFPNAYFIAESGSLTTPDDYQKFCQKLGAEFEVLSENNFTIPVHAVNYGILCKEVVYDCNKLRGIVTDQLDSSGVIVKTSCEVGRIEKRPFGKYRLFASDADDLGQFDYVINCTYANINRLTGQLGFPVVVNQYEYTFTPVVELDIPKVGVTVMDGPFMTLLPYGKSNRFLLYHVEHSVIARENAVYMNQAWLNEQTSPLSTIDKTAHFQRMIKDCSVFLPNLLEAKMIGYMHGPRMVLSKSDATDSRPSIVKFHGDGSYCTIFSGKIDHCMWVADAVCEHIIHCGEQSAQ